MSRGFTLIELLVVIAIIGIMSLAVLGDQGAFTANLALRSAADEIVLAFREAHVRAFAVSESPKTPNLFDIGYGVYVEGAGAILFVDTDKDGQFDGDAGACSNECISKIKLPVRTSIVSIRGSGSIGCSAASIDGIAATFVRPRPEADIAVKKNSAWSPSCGSLTVEIEHSSGENLEVVFYPNADINVIRP